MNELQRSNLGEIPRRQFSMNTDGSPVLLYSPVMLGAQVLESDRPEYHYLASSRLCGGRSGNVAAAAGLFTAVMLANPANSNLLCVVSELYLVAGASGIDVKLTQMLPTGAPIQCTVRDSRWQTGNAGALLGKPVCTMSSDNTLPASPAEPSFCEIGGNVTRTYNQPIVISPGFMISIISSVVNGSVLASVNWYEKPVARAELR